MSTRASGNPFAAAKLCKSRQWWPIATAGRGTLLEEVEMIPKGMLARENGVPEGIGSHDFGAMMISSLLIMSLKSVGLIKETFLSRLRDQIDLCLIMSDYFR